MAKSPEAFRTISEVSALLETPAHVLRFWESKFPQVKPVKRAGGRRYYRPDDVQLLGGIKVLLHDRGMTIRGVQKILREEGARHVAGLAPPQVWIDGPGEEAIDAEGLDGPLDDAPADGVIVGPWRGPEEEGDADLADPLEAGADEEDLSDLLAVDGLDEPPEPEVAVAVAADATAPLQANGSGIEGSSPLASFIAGTLRHVAEAAPAPAPAADPQPAPAPALPPGPPTPERAILLLRHADPERLRARADRIAPLLARLRALREGLPRPGA